jgi:hypothetical protein
MGAPTTNMGNGGGGGGRGGGGGPSLKLDHRGANISLPMHIIGSLLGGMRGPAPQMAGRLGAAQIGQGGPGMGGQGFQGLTPQMMQAALVRPTPRAPMGAQQRLPNQYRPQPIPNMRELPMSPTSHMPQQAGGGQGMQQLMAMAAQGRRPMRGVRYGSHVYLGGDPALEESWHEVA